MRQVPAAVGAPYRTMSRLKGDGVIDGVADRFGTPSFAPQVRMDGDVVIGQTAAILLYPGRSGAMRSSMPLRGG